MQEDQNSVLIFILATIIIVLLAMAVVVFVMLYNRKRADFQIKFKDAEIQKQKDLLNAELSSTEAERNRLASELHDDVNNRLTLHRMLLQNIGDESFKKDLLGSIDETMSQIRDMSHSLSSQAVKKFGLVDGILMLKDKLEASGSIKMIVDSAEYSRKVAEDVSIHLYRITQELINNSIKHSEASSIEIRLSNTEYSLQYSYSDNGKGCDPEKIENAEDGLGLKNVESRCYHIGARFQWITQVNEGFKFNCELKDD